jgi:hypothetical protein
VADTVVSKNGVPIRLTDEHWIHITEEHAELAGYRLEVLETIGDPERIVAGNAGELLAIRVITAFLTRQPASLKRRKQMWP